MRGGGPPGVLALNSGGRGGEHPVDQPGDRPDPGRVALAPVPVDVGHRPEPPEPADGVLDHDPPPAECPVVLPVLGRAVLTPGLPPGGRPEPAGVEVGDPDVGQVPDPTDARRESLQEPGLLQQLDVRPRPGAESDTSTTRPDSSSTPT